MRSKVTIRPFSESLPKSSIKNLSGQQRAGVFLSIVASFYHLLNQTTHYQARRRYIVLKLTLLQYARLLALWGFYYRGRVSLLIGNVFETLLYISQQFPIKFDRRI